MIFFSKDPKESEGVSSIFLIFQTRNNKYESLGVTIACNVQERMRKIEGLTRIEEKRGD